MGVYVLRYNAYNGSCACPKYFPGDFFNGFFESGPGQIGKKMSPD